MNYQPFIIKNSEVFIHLLEDEVEDIDYFRKLLCEEMTKKFINGTLSSNDPVDTIFYEEELLNILLRVDIQKNLNKLIEEKLIDTIENENDEEMFFLTQKGKKVCQELFNDCE